MNKSPLEEIVFRETLTGLDLKVEGSYKIFNMPADDAEKYVLLAVVIRPYGFDSVLGAPVIKITGSNADLSQSIAVPHDENDQDTVNQYPVSQTVRATGDIAVVVETGADAGAMLADVTVIGFRLRDES